ncbi:hypothetical protein CFB40_33135 [Burkholderia sp. AU31652]|uniref:hypothetical protein n=1 Tax=unclassified Burkholderia TaxID=2613784 RepID=UPI000B79FF30|nr:MULTISPECIES: hypothetical protein [unclassified Burkholderia]OXI79189.1 hypothetical protein CFB40_33135 [Burkholderia sp. AU31652]OXJ07399.1 hypothetical protein CFB45_35025 [Burkholderia sp. HI2500]
MYGLTAVRSTHVIAWVATALSVSVAGIGWLHTTQGRRLLTELGVKCPVDSVDSRTVLSIRNKAILQEKGVSAAPQRPAFGLQLDRSTEADVLEKMPRYNAQCVELTRGLRYLRCRGVPAEMLGSTGPPVSEIWFSFAPDRTLMAINVYRRDMSVEETRLSWQIAVRHLHDVLGAPTSVSGDTTLESLIGKPVAVARVSYAYSDYVATVTASHLPYGGLAVREQYMSAAVKQEG